MLTAMPPLEKPPLLPPPSPPSSRRGSGSSISGSKQLRPLLPPRPRSSSRSLSPSSRRPRARTLSSDDPLKILERQLQTTMQAQGHGHANTAKLYNEMGNIHFRQGNLHAANDSYQQALLCDAGSHIATAYMNLGTVYWSAGDASRALVVLEKAMESHKEDLAMEGHKVEESPMAASVYHQMGLCHALQRDYFEAMHCMKEAYTIRKTLHKTVEVAKTLDAMGKICYMQGEFEAALKHHDLAYHMLNLTNAPTMNVLKNMANAYEALGSTNQAIAIWKDLADHFRQKPLASPSLQATLLTMARLFEKGGNQTKAAACFQEAQQLIS